MVGEANFTELLLVLLEYRKPVHASYVNCVFSKTIAWVDILFTGNTLCMACKQFYLQKFFAKSWTFMHKLFFNTGVNLLEFQTTSLKPPSTTICTHSWGWCRQWQVAKSLNFGFFCQRHDSLSFYAGVYTAYGEFQTISSRITGNPIIKICGHSLGQHLQRYNCTQI